MRTLQILILFLTFSTLAIAGPIHTGKLKVEKISANQYKMFLDSKPTKNIWPYPDSAALWIGIACPNGEYESHQIGWRDTIYYEVIGRATLATSINWFKNGNPAGRNDMLAPDIHDGNAYHCYKFEKIGKFFTDPIIGTPPQMVPEIWVNNWLLESNSPGTLLVFDSGFSGIHFSKTYNGPFSYQFDSGTWWVQVVWLDGSFTPMTEYVVP